MIKWEKKKEKKASNRNNILSERKHCIYPTGHNSKREMEKKKWEKNIKDKKKKKKRTESLAKQVQEFTSNISFFVLPAEDIGVTPVFHGVQCAANGLVSFADVPGMAK
jgi:hypothetical protein